LHLALARPELVRGLVLIGATAGIDDDVERAGRRSADEALASHIEAIGVEAFIDEWLGGPLFAALDDDAAQRTDRLRNTAAGLAASLRTAGAGTQYPLWVRLGEIGQPTLVLVGADDHKFVPIARRLGAAIPRATVVEVAGAGHAAHLEQSDSSASIVADWLVTSGVATSSP
jgi:pimeloyl-ACP methyl ester carboxylesterase